MDPTGLTPRPPQASTLGGRPAAAPRPRARVIVVGNEKGGSGKSTTAMHLAVAALRRGLSVGSLDLDSRQATFTRYLENRATANARRNAGLPVPDHHLVPLSTYRHSAMAAEQDEHQRLSLRFADLAERHDVVVIDTPGTDNHLSRLGHSLADVLVTPINDSFVDLDLLALVDPDTLRIVRPSRYSEMVWEQKKQRALRDGGSIDWVVMRNRLSHLDARNKRDVARVLDELARRLRCRLVAGFGERVIFRELFLQGLTLLDLREDGSEVALNLSHVAARQEVRALIEAVGLAAPAPAAADPAAPAAIRLPGL